MKIITILIALYVAFIMNLDSMGQIPGAEWVKTGGGMNTDWNIAVSSDSYGNVFVAGKSSSTYIVFENDTIFSTGVWQLFLVKYSSSGSYLWARSFPFPYFEGYLPSLAVDKWGNAIITGTYTDSLVFDNYILCSAAGSSDFFIAKFDTAGNVCWAKSFGGTSYEGSSDICCDSKGNICVTGIFWSNQLIFDTVNLYNSSGSGSYFLTKLDPDGNVIWAKGGGGTSAYSRQLAIDKFDNVVLCVYSNSPVINFDTLNVLNTSSTLSVKLIAKFNETGNVLWVELIPVPVAALYSVNPVYLTTDNLGDIYSSGEIIQYTVFGADTLFSSGPSDVFLAKYSSSGYLKWKNQISGNDDNYSAGVSYDNNGHIFLVVNTNSPFLLSGVDTLFNMASYNFAVFKYDTVGSSIWGLFSGISGNSNFLGCSGINIDSVGNIVLIGCYNDYGTIPLIFNNINLTSQGGMDVFATKYGTIVDRKEIESVMNGLLFPNPSSGRFSLKLDNEAHEILVVNVYGNVLEHFKSSGIDMIDLFIPENGIYFICVSSERRWIKYKAVVCK